MVLSVTVVKLPKMEKSEIENHLPGTDALSHRIQGKRVHVYGSIPICVDRRNDLLPMRARIEKYRPDPSEYNFVVLRCELEVAKEPQERTHVINKIVAEGKQRLSPNFLAAHGFKKEAGWSAITPERPMVIVKLKDVAERTDLKSPE